jgi:hypothetical protein
MVAYAGQMRGRGPTHLQISPAQAFALFVAWCTLGIIATVLIIAFFPWSVPFWIAAILVGTWLGGSALRRILRQ